MSGVITNIIKGKYEILLDNNNKEIIEKDKNKTGEFENFKIPEDI